MDIGGNAHFKFWFWHFAFFLAQVGHFANIVSHWLFGIPFLSSIKEGVQIQESMFFTKSHALMVIWRSQKTVELWFEEHGVKKMYME